MTNAFPGFQFLKDANNWAGKQTQGAVYGLAMRQASQCSHSSLVCFG